VSYPQQTDYAAATPQTLLFTVTVAPVSVALTPSTTYGPAGAAISFTAAITSKTGGTPNAIGTISFTDGATALGSVAVNAAGQAVFTTSILSAGTHTITASYNGAGQYGNGSASTAVTVAQAASTTKLTAASTSLTLGQAAQLTATVTGVNPTGAVVFASNGTTLCTSPLSAGTATCSFTPSAAGGMSVTAKYQGDTNNLPSGAYLNLAISSPVDAAITLQFASTTLTYPGQTNVTVCVASLKKSAVTGSVQVLDGTALLTTQTLSGNGCAYWYIAPALAVGSHSITAAYSGDKNNPAGVSAATVITVNPIPVSLAISAGNTSIPYGVSFYRTVTVSSNAGSPLGSIAYSLDGGAAVAATLSSGNAKFSIALPAAGSHQVVVSYAAQGNFAAASSLTVSFTIVQAAVSITLTPAFASTRPGVSLSFLAGVTSTSAGAPNADGAVSFFDGTTLLGVAPVNAQGQASFATSSLLNGTHTITATYSQATNFGSGSAVSKVWIGN
jgi:hypothetical protein